MKLEESKALDQLIEDSQKLVSRNWKKGPKKELFLSNLKKNQIRNILDMAQATDSFKALQVFILYQAGRKMIAHEFAEDLASELEKIQKDGGIKSVRLYLGYLYRYFIWKKSQEGDGSD
ncbi:MAG: hypothetical protein WBA22_15240 [Candidatus Methanofastidiosia archaeon]|jgi:CRISPR/Cas system CSM-associated protein Csm2 small subunit